MAVATRPATDSLWDRLGGESVLSRVVDEFVNLATTDPKVNYTRDGRFPLDDQALASAKRTALEIISMGSGGPLVYTGRTIREIHQGMRITDAEFDAIAADFRTALGRSGADPADLNAALERVEAARSEIVELPA
jgi:truncated hemoglobin YjbI